MYSQHHPNQNQTLHNIQQPPIGFEGLYSTSGQNGTPSNYNNNINGMQPRQSSELEPYPQQTYGWNEKITGNGVVPERQTRSGDETGQLAIVAISQPPIEEPESGCWLSVKVCCACLGGFLCLGLLILVKIWSKIRRKMENERRMKQYLND